MLLGQLALDLGDALLRAEFEEGLAHGGTLLVQDVEGGVGVGLGVSGIGGGFAGFGAAGGVEEREGDDDPEGDVVVLKASWE